MGFMDYCSTPVAFSSTSFISAVVVLSEMSLCCTALTVDNDFGQQENEMLKRDLEVAKAEAEAASKLPEAESKW